MKLAILQQVERSLVQIRFPLRDQVGSDQKVKMVVPFSPQAANSLNGLKTLKPRCICLRSRFLASLEKWPSLLEAQGYHPTQPPPLSPVPGLASVGPRICTTWIA